MPDLSYLETISNKELHAKCLEYGLPNIPVTDTSRNVILRRLRATILGAPRKNSIGSAKAPRRETVHSNLTSTTAATNTNATRAAGKNSSRNYNNNSRRTIASTPREYYPMDNSLERSVETTTTVSDVGSQSEDDDFYLVRSPPKPYLQKRDERSRRSVSLSKSGVLTTSYTREVQQPHYEEDEEPQSYTYQRPVVETPTYSLPIYEPPLERQSGPELSRSNLTQSRLNSTSYSEAINDYNDPRSRQSPRDSYSGSTAPFSMGVASTSGVRQRHTYGDGGFARGQLLQPTFTANTLYPKLNEFYDQQNRSGEPMDLDTDSESEPEIRGQSGLPGGNVESPYLSHFSRQLDARKLSSPLARPQMRSTIRQPDPNSPIQQFRALFNSLDRQYHIKFYLLLTVAVIIATFIYVIVTPV